jgi:molybdopterin synthase sulfur carrier subunit
MPRVFIPPLLRPLTGDVEEVTVDAKNVRQVIDMLESQFPGIKSRLCDDDGLKPDLSVAVDGNVSSLGLLQHVRENSEVHFLPAIGGG